MTEREWEADRRRVQMGERVDEDVREAYPELDWDAWERLIHDHRAGLADQN